MKIRKRVPSRVFLKSAVFCLIFCLCFFSGVFGQESAQEEQSQTEFSPGAESAGPNQNPVTIGGGMWGNQPQVQPSAEASQASGANSEDMNSDAESNGGDVIAPGRGGIRRTTSGGVTREAAGGGPGPNPDVPFDENMNLLFLLTGLIFAFLVTRKRRSSQPSSVR